MRCLMGTIFRNMDYLWRWIFVQLKKKIIDKERRFEYWIIYNPRHISRIFVKISCINNRHCFRGISWLLVIKKKFWKILIKNINFFYTVKFCWIVVLTYFHQEDTRQRKWLCWVVFFLNLLKMIISGWCRYIMEPTDKNYVKCLLPQNQLLN